MWFSHTSQSCILGSLRAPGRKPCMKHVHYRLSVCSTGWRCAVQAEVVQHRLKDAKQRVSLSLYYTSSDCTSGVPQPVLHTYSPYCTYFMQGAEVLNSGMSKASDYRQTSMREILHDGKVNMK